jgi:hypothetical protein
MISLALEANKNAEIISQWAEEAENEVARKGLRNEAAWFARRSARLRRQAFWKGLTQGPWTDGGWDTEALVIDLGNEEAFTRHRWRAEEWLRRDTDPTR